MKGPVEAKVAASSIAALVVPALFAAAAYYHWFTPPPAALQAAIIAVVTGAAGWLAPHTSRPLSTPTMRELEHMAQALNAQVTYDFPNATMTSSPVSHTGPPGSTVTYKNDPPPARPPAGGKP